MIQLNPQYKVPLDYKPPQTKLSDKVLIPQEEYPDINFVGLLIGPRGNTLKSMERDTGAKIIIRGKGSIKEGKIGRKDGQPLPGEDEPLHAFLTAPTEEAIAAATKQINKIITQAIELPENQNNLRRTQLRELALLNGTLRENDVLSKKLCSNCGSVEHRNWQCPEKTNVVNTIVCSKCNGKGHLEKDCKYEKPENEVEIQKNFDEEYLHFMAELGGGPVPNKSSASTDTTNNVSSTNANEGSPLALTYTNDDSKDNSKDNAKDNAKDNSKDNSTQIPKPEEEAKSPSENSKKLVTWIQQQGVWKQVVQEAPVETPSEPVISTPPVTTAQTVSSTDPATSSYVYNYYLQQSLAAGQDMQTAIATAIASCNAYFGYAGAYSATPVAPEVNKTYNAVPPLSNLSPGIIPATEAIPQNTYGYGTAPYGNANYFFPPPPPS